MKKSRLLVLLLALVMILAACGNDSQSENSGASDMEFNPDSEDGKSIEDIRESLGNIKKIDGEITLGAVAKSFENEYWRTLKEGYEEFEKKVKEEGVDITVDIRSARGENDEQGQLSIVSDMINKKVGGLLLSPISDGNLVPGVEDALKAGIPVINVNDGLISNAPTFVGPKADQNGELAAEWLYNQLDGKGEVGIVIGMPKAFAARQRTSGFENWIEKNASDMKIVAKQNADWDRSKAKDLAETWIKQYPDIKGIFCNNDVMALGVQEAVNKSGKDILVVGVDGTGEAYESIRKGEMDATVDSFPFYKAQIASEMMLRAINGQEVPRVVWTPQAIIDKTNVDVPASEIINWTDPVYE